MDQATQDKLILKFLTHSLEEHEIPVFKAKLENDAAFAQRVKDEAALMLSVKAIEKTDNDLLQKSKRRIFIRRLAAVAAVLLAVFTISLLLQPSKGQRLAKQYYQATEANEVLDDDNNINITRTSGQPTGDEEQYFKKGLNLYEKGQYKAAITEFGQAITDSDFRNTVLLYRGNAYLKLKEFELANKDFQSIINGSRHVETKIKATWYQALSFLNLGQTDLAIENLEALKSAKGPYALKAKELLSNL